MVDYVTPRLAVPDETVKQEEDDLLVDTGTLVREIERGDAGSQSVLQQEL